MNKLIKINEQHYVVCDDSEIKEGDWYYDFTDKEGSLPIYQRSQCPKFYSGCKKITHSTQPLEHGTEPFADGVQYVKVFDKIKPLPLSEVEEAIYGYKNKFLKFFKNELNYKNYWKPLIEDNPQLIEAHKELVKDKLFTVEDMKLFAAELIGRYKSGKIQEFEDVQDIIESYLPKTEWDIEFIDGKIKLI